MNNVMWAKIGNQVRRAIRNNDEFVLSMRGGRYRYFSRDYLQKLFTSFSWELTDCPVDPHEFELREEEPE
jgi:hypothetical protein